MAHSGQCYVAGGATRPTLVIEQIIRYTASTVVRSDRARSTIPHACHRHPQQVHKTKWHIVQTGVIEQHIAGITAETSTSRGAVVAVESSHSTTGTTGSQGCVPVVSLRAGGLASVIKQVGEGGVGVAAEAGIGVALAGLAGRVASHADTVGGY